MYAKARPIVINCPAIPDGHVAIMSTASTITELKRDIIGNTELRNSDVDKFQFTTDTHGVLTNAVPLFEKSCDILDVNDSRFDGIVDQDYVDEHLQDDDGPYLYVTLSESRKLYNSGATVCALSMNNIEECCAIINNRGDVDKFVEKYGIQPEAAGLNTLKRFINESQVEKLVEKKKKEEGDPLVAQLNKLTEAMIEQNRNFATAIGKLSEQVSRLSTNYNTNANTNGSGKEEYVPGKRIFAQTRNN